MENIILGILGLWIGIAPGILFGKGINTKEWWIFVLPTITLITINVKI